MSSMFCKDHIKSFCEGDEEFLLVTILCSVNMSTQQIFKSLPGNDGAHGRLIGAFLPQVTFLPVSTDIVDYPSSP
jgi:hypothetical protein